jgi:uncharacterized protein (TIGR03086 family)
MNVPELHRRACDGFTQRVHEIRDDQWGSPTPCSDWDVRTLVNHVTAENLWTPPLFGGRTIEDVGDRFDGDVLGDDPVRAWDESARDAVAAAQEDGAMERTVHLSFGDFPGSEYASQLFADYLIHSWDLARAIGSDERLDPELVEACAQWFAEREALYRSAGAIADRVDLPDNADPQAKLLAMFGRAA